MKIQLDTTAKTIRIEEPVNLGEFIELLDKQILPDGHWKEFKLETQTIIGWVNPVIINPINPCPYPWYDQPYYTTNSQLVSGVYNVDVDIKNNY